MIPAHSGTVTLTNGDRSFVVPLVDVVVASEARLSESVGVTAADLLGGTGASVPAETVKLEGLNLTDDEARALGERWIKAGGGWRRGATSMEVFAPPMITLPKWDEAVVLWTPDPDDARVPACTVLGKVRPLHDGAIPDPRDPATVGTWLATVRERHGADAYVAPVRGLGHWDAIVLSGPRKGRKVGPDGWAVYGLGLDVLPVGGSEAEALVAALEAGAL